MAIPGTVQVTGKLAPTDNSDTYAVTDQIYAKDGLRNVNSKSDLHLISSDRRRAGMIVGVKIGSPGTTTYYKLLDAPWSFDDSDWLSVELDAKVVHDIKMSQVFNQKYENPETVLANVPIGTPGLPIVETYYPNFSKFNSDEFGTAHSLLYLNGYIYLSTRQMPARVAKIKEDDFSIVQIITFPGSNSTSLYSIADKMIYSDYTNKIYIPFGDPDYNRGLRVAELNPDDISDYSIVIDEVGFLPGFPTGIALNDKLYVLTGYQGRLREYDLDTFTMTRNLTFPAGSEQQHAINSDGRDIFITEIYPGAKVQKISLDTFTITDSVSLPAEHMTDGFAIAGDYLWVGSESAFDAAANKGVYMINKHDLSDYNRIFVENTDSIWEVMYDNEYIWVLFASSPGEMLRINPQTLEVNKAVFDTGFNNPNSIVKSKSSFFVSTFDVPTQILKMPLPKIFQETYFAGTDNDVLLKISNITKSVEFKSTIISVTYAQLVALISGNLLSAGSEYKLTDFATKYEQVETLAIKTATVEPLIVTATSDNTISTEVKSTLYPTDIIYYDVTDNLCEDASTPRNGRIYYRKDTATNKSTWYDFMGIQFVRYRPTANTAYDPGTTFNKGDIVSYLNKLYICIVTSTLGNTPGGGNNYYWAQWLDNTNSFDGGYALFSDSDSDLNWKYGDNGSGVNIDYSQLTINPTPIEVYTFCNIDDDTNPRFDTLNGIEIGKDCDNIVIFSSNSNSPHVQNLKIEPLCTNISLHLNYINDVSIGSESQNLLIGEQSYSWNTVKLGDNTYDTNFQISGVDLELYAGFGGASLFHGSWDNSDVIGYYGCIIGRLRNCHFKNGIDSSVLTDMQVVVCETYLNGIDLSNDAGATHIYNNASKTIYQDLTDGPKLRFYDEGIIIIVNITD